MEDQKIIVEESEGDEIITPPTPEQKAEIEKLEEQKLKSKFPGRVPQVRSFSRKLPSVDIEAAKYVLSRFSACFQSLVC